MKYERVTRKDGVIWEEDYTLTDLHNRLFDLENAIEAGTLVELPCKIGDNAYGIDMFSYKPKICYGKLFDVEIDDRGIKYTIKTDSDYISTLDTFLTKEEAEARLKELRGEL